MAKERTMNEIRQTKEYYTGNNIETMKECPLDPVEEAKILIVDKITKHFSDFIFHVR